MSDVVADAKTRFSGRVGDYVKYRPGYPGGVVEFLKGEIGLSADWVVADVGAGTGISSALFLGVGCEVVGVEPNAEMRGAMVAMLGGNPKFRAVDGAAEGTGLAGGSVDLVICAQAFHWFDVDGARREFKRILRGGEERRTSNIEHPTSNGEGGWVVLMWNDREREGGLAGEYDGLLKRWGVDYERVRHDRVPVERIGAFFWEGMRVADFPNQQEFDWAGLRGRLMSSSYAPMEGQAGHVPMMEGLRGLYEKYAVGGHVTFGYRTRLFYGRLE